MNEVDYCPSKSVLLRDVGKNEKWLQNLIENDPSILGLGDLTVITREKKQASGGRLDFLLWDPEDEIRYEVEVMLGRLDESHIIRAIEYWDLERNRYPNYEHKAVIVAENITSRFFNILGLMNKSIPIIAIQLNALVVGKNSLALNFAKLLDVTELASEEIEGSEIAKDRSYWVNRSNPDSLKIMDSIVEAIPGTPDTKKLTYNQGHIAVRTGGRNFCWFHLRKSPQLLFNLLVGDEGREQIVQAMAEDHINAKLRGDRELTIRITGATSSVPKSVVDALIRAEGYSRGESTGE
jgi:hypothetical protein